MIIYMAGDPTSKMSQPLLESKTYPLVNRLMSYMYPQQLRNWISKIEAGEDPNYGKRKLIIDSGAFTAWNKGVKISIQRYLEYVQTFIQKNERHFQNIYVVNLDVIPGGRGVLPSQKEKEESAEAGFKNYLFLRDNGIDSIHVYHEGEDLRWLDKIKNECKYMGISPSNDSSTDRRMRWLDDAFHIIDSKKTMTHGFAVTAFDLMQRYPWTSVDSASWSLQGAYGNVNTPYGLIYFGFKLDEDRAYYNLNSMIKAKADEWFNSIGITAQQLRADYVYRAHANYYYLKYLERKVNDNKVENFTRPQGMLFETQRLDENLMNKEISMNTTHEAVKVEETPEIKQEKAVIIVSGGMDSVTLLHDVINHNYEAHVLSFDYGQRHKIELEMVKQTCKKLSVTHKIIDITDIGQQLLQGSALTTKELEVPQGHYTDENMKLTVVPNRNMILLSLALGYAISIKAVKLFYGAHSGDHTIYPDCRPEFLTAFKETAKLCDWHIVDIKAPYLNLNKISILKRGLTLDVDYSKTWTCYNPQIKDDKTYACGKCGSCQERLEAFKLNEIQDPVQYL